MCCDNLRVEKVQVLFGFYDFFYKTLLNNYVKSKSMCVEEHLREIQEECMRLCDIKLRVNL